jgi:hypothetical protein
MPPLDSVRNTHSGYVGYSKHIDDRKVTQPILKYLLVVEIKYSSIGLINTQYRCDYTRGQAGHVML